MRVCVRVWLPSFVWCFDKYHVRLTPLAFRLVMFSQTRTNGIVPAAFPVNINFPCFFLFSSSFSVHNVPHFHFLLSFSARYDSGQDLEDMEGPGGGMHGERRSRTRTLALTHTRPCAPTSSACSVLSGVVLSLLLTPLPAFFFFSSSLQRPM